MYRFSEEIFPILARSALRPRMACAVPYNFPGIGTALSASDGQEYWPMRGIVLRWLKQASIMTN